MTRKTDLPPGASVGWVLILGALFWIALAYAAFAQGYPSMPYGAKRFVVEPGAGDCAEHVLVIDRPGMYSRDTTVQTSLGAVVFRYTTHGAQQMADTAEVMDMDADLSVAPMFADLVPNQPVTFCVRKAKGAS